MQPYRLEITKSQIELLIGLLKSEHKLHKNRWSLRDIGRIACLDYQGCLYRNKDWLCEHKILVGDDEFWKVDYDAIAELLFDKTDFAYIYRFAYRHLEYSL